LFVLIFFAQKMFGVLEIRWVDLGGWFNLGGEDEMGDEMNEIPMLNFCS
jgi:hypothetical protein